MESINTIAPPNATGLSLERPPIGTMSHLGPHLLGRIATFCPGEIHSLSREATAAHLNNMLATLRKLVNEKNFDVFPFLRDLSITDLTSVSKDDNLSLASGFVNQMFQRVVEKTYALALIHLGTNDLSLGDIYNLLERKDLSEIIKSVKQKTDHSSLMFAEALRADPHRLPIPQGTPSEIRSWFASEDSQRHLSQVETLDLSNKRLKIIPFEIRHLRYLYNINLSKNELTYLPEAFSLILRGLESLNLSNNQLTTLPSNLNILQDLKSLDLSHNQLTTLPEKSFALDDFMCDLRSLETLDLSHNQLITLPKSLTKLQNCSNIQLENNKISLGNLSPKLQVFLKRKEINLDELQSSQRIQAQEEVGGGGGGGGGGGKK